MSERAGSARPGPMTKRLLAVAVVGALLGATALSTGAQPPRPPAAPDHGAHGTPPGWRFAWPRGGDATKGREVFVKLECYSCHEVKGERFPVPGGDRIGPELSMMGPLHEAEYFAEAIINPGAVLEPGKGYAAPDGSSKMPAFNDSITVQELIDLIAFLRALKPPADGHGGGLRP